MRDAATETTTVSDSTTAAVSDSTTAATPKTVEPTGDKKDSSSSEEVTLDTVKKVSNDSSSSEELTVESIQKLKNELLDASMPEKYVNILEKTLVKLTPNTTDEEKMDGFVSDNYIEFYKFICPCLIYRKKNLNSIECAFISS